MVGYSGVPASPQVCCVPACLINGLLCTCLLHYLPSGGAYIVYLTVPTWCMYLPYMMTFSGLTCFMLGYQAYILTTRLDI